MHAHTVAQTFDVGGLALAGVLSGMHEDARVAQAEADFAQHERNLGAVGRVAARVRRDGAVISALQAENAALRAELAVMRDRALAAEGKLVRALRAVRDMCRAA